MSRQLNRAECVGGLRPPLLLQALLFSVDLVCIEYLLQAPQLLLAEAFEVSLSSLGSLLRHLLLLSGGGVHGVDGDALFDLPAALVLRCPLQRVARAAVDLAAVRALCDLPAQLEVATGAEDRMAASGLVRCSPPLVLRFRVFVETIPARENACLPRLRCP